MISAGFQVWQKYLFRQPKHSLTLPSQQNGVRAGHHAAAKDCSEGSAVACHRLPAWSKAGLSSLRHMPQSCLAVGWPTGPKHTTLQYPYCEWWWSSSWWWPWWTLLWPCTQCNACFLVRGSVSFSLLLTPYPEEAREGAVFLCVLLYLTFDTPRLLHWKSHGIATFTCNAGFLLSKKSYR